MGKKSCFVDLGFVKTCDELVIGPKVDVKADGPNVIIIRMTFPDNENIQGLRAFTPTQEETVDQFSAINDILPPNTSVERISANQQSSVNNNALSRNEKLIRRDPVPIAPKPTPSLSFPGTAIIRFEFKFPAKIEKTFSLVLAKGFDVI